MAWRIAMLMFAVGVGGCASGPASDRRDHEDALIAQLHETDPAMKMAAADDLRRLGVARAVPHLLYEARDAYPTVYAEPDPETEWRGVLRNYIIEDGERRPYVDYHQPLFRALSELAVPYFPSDEAWFAAIERWIVDHGHQVMR